MANDTNTPDRSTDDVEVEFVPAPSVQKRMDEYDAAHGIDSTTPATRSTRQLVKDEAGKLGGNATDRLRAFADDGKTRASGALDDLAKMIDDAAGTIDEKVGPQFGGYARSAAGVVTNFSEGLRGKDVDDLVDDAKEFVRKSPGVAIGAAAAVGFVVARVVSSAIDANRKA